VDCSAPRVAHVARQLITLWQTSSMGGGCGCSEALEENDSRVGHAAEKPPGLVQDFLARRVQCTKMGQNAGKMKINLEVTDGLQGNTGRIEMGRERKNRKSF
jgi:hypothetical protein